MRGTTRSLKHLRRTGFPGSHSEVGNLDVTVAIEQQILGLKVAMSDVESMAVVHGRYNLLKIMESFVYGKSSARYKVIEEFASFDILDDKVSSGIMSSRHLEQYWALTSRYSSHTHHTG